MNIRNSITFIILTILMNLNELQALDDECIIYSDYYEGQYLYSPNDFVSMGTGKDRYALVWRGFLLERLVSDKSYAFFTSDSSALWTLIPATGVPNGYYLRNMKYNEYLYASNKKHDYFFGNKRRKVYTRQLPESFGTGPSFSRDQFVWRLERHGALNYHIYNVFYNEPLYVASINLRHDGLRRNIFTWHKKPDSKQFLFVLSCSQGYFSI